MSNITNILVPFVNADSAEGALRMAIQAAKIYAANLHILYVESGKPPSEILAIAKGICDEYKQEFVFMEKSGAIHTCVLKTEKEIKADIIFMGAYGKSGIQQLWIGSNTFKVVSSSQCPVITLQNNAESRSGFNKIMLPLDDSDETRQKINWVIKIAKGFDAEVLIFCVSKVNDPAVRGRLAIYADQVQTFLTENGIRSSFDESYGNNVAEDCIKFAQMHNCDLISIMTEMENTNSFFMGSYAQQIVSTSPVPIMSIHSRSVRSVIGGL